MFHVCSMLKLKGFVLKRSDLWKVQPHELARQGLLELPSASVLLPLLILGFLDINKDHDVSILTPQATSNFKRILCHESKVIPVQPALLNG
jgi:hypothetical protein